MAISTYATEGGNVIKASMIDLPECTINQEDPSTRVEFMVALLEQSAVWCLFYNQGGDWNIFGDGEENNAETVQDWMPDALRECAAAVSKRVGEKAADDMDWFIDWADSADVTLADA